MFKTLSKFLVQKNRQQLLLDPEIRLLMGLLSDEGSRKERRTLLQSRTCVIVKQSPNRTVRREYTLSKETFVGQKKVRKSSQENLDDEVNAKYEDVKNKACDAKKHKESQNVEPGSNKCGKKLRDANRRLAELEKTIDRDIQELKQKRHDILQTMSTSNTKRKKTTSERGNKRNEELKDLEGIRNHKDKHKFDVNFASSQKNLGHEENKNVNYELKDNDIKKNDFLKYLMNFSSACGGNDQIVNACGCECCNQYYRCRPYAYVNLPEAVLSPGSVCIQEEFCYRNYRQCANDHCMPGHVWNCCCSSKKINQIAQSYKRRTTDLQTENFCRRTSSRSPSPVQGKKITQEANIHSQGESNITRQKVNERTQKGDNTSPQSFRTPSKSSSPDRSTGVKHQKDSQNKIKSHKTTTRSNSQEDKRAKENKMLVNPKPRRGESEKVLSQRERKIRGSNSNGLSRKESGEVLGNRSSRKTYSPILDAAAVQSTSEQRDIDGILRNRRTLVDFCNSPKEHMQDTLNETFNAPSTSNGSRKYSTETMREFKKMKIREYTAVPPNDNNIAKSDGSKLKQRAETRQMSEEKAKRYREYLKQYKNYQQNHESEFANHQRHEQSDHDYTEEELYAYSPNSVEWGAYDENDEIVYVEEYKQKVQDLLGIEDDTVNVNKLNKKPQARGDNAKLRSRSTEKSTTPHSSTRSRMEDRSENPKSDFKQSKEKTNKTKQFYSNNRSPLYNDHQKHQTFKDSKVEASKSNQTDIQYDTYGTSDATQSPRSVRSKRNNNAIDPSRTYSNLNSDKNRGQSVSKEIKSATTYVLSSCSQDTPKEKYIMEKRKKESLQSPQSPFDTKPKPMTSTNTKEKAREHSTKQNQVSDGNKPYTRSNKHPSSYKNFESNTRENNRLECNSPQIKTVIENDESSSLASTIGFLGDLLKCYRKGLLVDKSLKALAEELYANFSTHPKCKGSSWSCEDKATYACQEKRTIDIQCNKSEKSEHCPTENESKISEPKGSDTFHDEKFTNRVLEKANNINESEYYTNKQPISETSNSSHKENDLTTGSHDAKPTSAATSQLETLVPQNLNSHLEDEVTSIPKLSQSFEDSTSPYKPQITTTGSEVSLNAAHNGSEQYETSLNMEHKNQKFESKDNFKQEPIDPTHTELSKNAEFQKEEFPTHSRSVNYNLNYNHETLSASNDNNSKLDINSPKTQASKNSCSTVQIPLNARSSNYECRYKIVDDSTNTRASKGILINCCPSDAYDIEESPNSTRELVDNCDSILNIQACKFETEDQYFDDECGASFEEEYEDKAYVNNYDPQCDSEDENSTWPSNHQAALQDRNINLPLKRSPTFRNCPCMLETYVNMMKIYNKHRQSPRFAESLVNC